MTRPVRIFFDDNTDFVQFDADALTPLVEFQEPFYTADDDESPLTITYQKLYQAEGRFLLHGVEWGQCSRQGYDTDWSVIDSVPLLALLARCGVLDQLVRERPAWLVPLLPLVAERDLTGGEVVTQTAAAKMPIAPPASPNGAQGKAAVSGRVVQVLLGKESERIFDVAGEPGDLDLKMRACARIDERLKGWKSPLWADLLGVTDSRIRQLPYWNELHPRVR